MPLMVKWSFGELIAQWRMLMAAVGQLVQVLAGFSSLCQLDCSVCSESSVSIRCFLVLLIDGVVRFQLLDHKISLLFLLQGRSRGVRVQG